MAKKKAKRSSRPKTFADTLRDAVRASGLTHYRIAKDSGTSPDQVDRFVGGRDSQISTIEKIAAGAGFRIVLEPLDED